MSDTYEYVAFPKWLYHADKPAIVVASEAEQRKAAKAGYKESPADFKPSDSEQ